MMIAKHYVEKEWTGLERERVQTRALKQKNEYILPVRIDITQVPGLKAAIAHINLNNTPLFELVEIIIKKLTQD